ncbi:MAG: hypothetical protein ACR2MS_06425 [Weeksellaceae bacterium]
MNINPLIVKSYLESLKEDNELDVIFTQLLQVLDFEILSTPLEYKGYSQYGKDIVAVQVDPDDNIRKRFYFELKAGDINNKNWFAESNGVRDTLIMTADKDFNTNYNNFENLPIKVILVFNGMVNEKVRNILNDLSQKEFVSKGIDFEEWNISILTKKFSDHLFGAYLLADQETTKIFNKVLINLNVSNHISEDYVRLLEDLFSKNEWQGWSKKKREWILLFQTIKLISFIIYTESKDYNNLDIAKRYLTHLVIKFWHWILKNKLENDSKIKAFFDEVLNFYLSVLSDYFQRTLTIAKIQDGLSYENSGRYEQIGYTKRTFEYLEYLTFLLNIDVPNPNANKAEIKKILSSVINSNSVSFRPLVDINSIPIIDILNLYIILDDKESAVIYLKGVFSYIINGKVKYDRLPDANNSYENVIRFTVTGEKPVYYSDSTSPLLAVLLEYTAILDLEEDYNTVRKFVIDNKIDLGIFTPHHGINSTSTHLIENTVDDLEEQLFSNPRLNDGYQRDIKLFVNLNEHMSFETFKLDYEKRIEEFQYDYRTDKAGYYFLRNLAHIYFQIPYFPDKWRNINIEDKL